MTTTTTTEVVPDSIHDQATLTWRRDCFQRMGFNEQQTLALALTRADMSDVARAIKAGCAPNLAFQIWS